MSNYRYICYSFSPRCAKSLSTEIKFESKCVRSHEYLLTCDVVVAVMMDSLTDVDKVLFHLEAKEFTVEPSTLQSLQQLIQWVADLALNLLARLPEQRQPGKSSGVRHAFCC